MTVLKIKPQRARLSGKDVSLDELVYESSCHIKIFDDENDVLKSLWIEFEGAITLFPSTANKHRIGRRGGVPFIMKDRPTQLRLQAAEIVFGKALIAEGIPLPSFGNRPTHVLQLCGQVTDRLFDSHNQSKALADWLQKVGVIANDANALVHPWKKKDDFRKSSWLGTLLERIFSEYQSTHIIVQAREFIQCLLEEQTYELIYASRKPTRLVG